MLRALAIETRVEPGLATACLPVTPHLLTSAGGVRLGVIAALVDVAGASLLLADLHPDRSATVTLSAQSERAVREGPLLATARVVRRGSRQVVVDVALRDGQGSDRPDAGVRSGRALMGFRRLPHRGDHAALPAPQLPSRGTLAHPAARLEKPFVERAGIRVVDADAGVLEIENHDWVRNSFGTLNGGMVATLLEMAGEQAARSALGPEAVAVDVEMQFVGQSGDGPIRTRASRIRTLKEHCVTRVEVLDAGADDALMAIGSVTSCALD